MQSFIILPKRLRRTIRQDHSMDEAALHMFNLAKSYEPSIFSENPKQFLTFVEIEIPQDFIFCIKGFVRISIAAGIAHAFLLAKMNSHSAAI